MKTIAPALLLATALLLAPSATVHAQEAVGGASVRPAAPAMPVRGGVVTVKVDDFGAARQRVVTAVLAEGGQVLDARTDVTDKGRRHGWVQLRLSSDRMERVLPTIREAGKLYAENLTTADRLSEHEDLGRRVGRLREHQDRLDALLQSPRRLRGSDILYVQERLFRAGVDEGMLEQRRLDIARGARTATLTVRLFEPLPVRAVDRARIDLAGWYAAARRNAQYRMDRTLARAATASAYALVYSPFWLPAAVIALLLLRELWVRTRALRARAVPAALSLGASALSWLATQVQQRRGRTAAPSSMTAPPADVPPAATP